MTKIFVMIELIPGIRNAARALIISQGRILLLRKEGGARGVRYALPGGAQDVGETLHAALRRECIEEIDTDVVVRELIHVADFIKLRDTQPPTRRHVLEFVFRCDVPEDYDARNGQRPDKHQVDVIWADLGELAALQLYPAFLSSAIPEIASGVSSVYLGLFEDYADS